MQFNNFVQSDSYSTVLSLSLPFRLLWPAWTTYNEKNESRLAKFDPYVLPPNLNFDYSLILSWDNGCEYELIFVFSLFFVTKIAFLHKL